jgi:hypothetical protein
MTRNWIAVNVVLLLAALTLGWQLYNAVRSFKAENDPSKIAPAGDVKKIIPLESGLPPQQPVRRYTPAEFEAISAKNLFSESRAAEEQTEQPQVVQTPELTVKPILVGVIQSGSTSLAMMVDPTAPDPKRRTQTRRVGDAYQGYTITEISPTRMVLEAGGRTEVIPLYDSSKHPAQGGKTPIIATRVVNFGAGGAGAATGSIVRQPTAAAASAEPARPSPAQQTQPARSTTRGSQQAASRGSVPQAAPQQAPATQQAPLAPGETRDSQGRRVLRTPWGDIVRPEPPPQH